MEQSGCLYSPGLCHGYNTLDLDILMKIKEAFELKKGRTYWISVGDKNNYPTQEQLYEIEKQLRKKNPKINFIIADFRIKLKDGTKKSSADRTQIQKRKR